MSVLVLTLQKMPIFEVITYFKSP